MLQIDKDHPPSVGPISQRYKWCCNNGCGECTPVLVEFRTYHSTLNGATDQERTEPRMVSRCCGEGMFLWDTTLDDDGPMGYDGALAGPPQKTQQPAPSTAAAFQQRVQPWLLECFGAEIAADRVERNHRFLEESLELVQALGCTASEAHQLVDYVFGRPVGDPPQEVGGVMVTLAALCLASGLDMHGAGEVELGRISAPELVAKIRAKQAAKPKHSPLPQSVAHQPGSALEDAALLDWQASARVEVSPEYEGPWHAAVFGEDEKPVFLASGNTPREALIAARKQGGAT